MLERLLPGLLLPGRLLQSVVVSSFLYGCATFPESREATLPRPPQNGQIKLEELNRIFELYGKSIGWTAEALQMDPGLIAAVMRYESNANSEAISSTGCTGLMQVCRGSATAPIKYVCAQEREEGPQECYTGKSNGKPSCELRSGVQWCEPCNGRDYCVLDDRFYPWKNLECGVKVLKGKIKHYQGKYTDYLRLGIAAYNAGEGIIDAAIDALVKETDGEVDKKDISWEKVYSKITLPIFRKFRWYNILTDAAIEQKINSLDNYVEKIYGAYWAYQEQREKGEQQVKEENQKKEVQQERNGENGEVPVG